MIFKYFVAKQKTKQNKKHTPFLIKNADFVVVYLIIDAWNP